MPSVFRRIGRIKPTYDMMYQAVMSPYKVLLVMDILIISIAVAGRYVPFIPSLIWSEEVAPTCTSYMAVLSTTLTIRRGVHAHMTAFDQYLPEKVVKSLDIIANLAVLAPVLIMITVGWKYTTGIGPKDTCVNTPKLSRFRIYLPVPLVGAVVLVLEIEVLYNHVRGFLVKEEME